MTADCDVQEQAQISLPALVLRFWGAGLSGYGEQLSRMGGGEKMMQGGAEAEVPKAPPAGEHVPGGGPAAGQDRVSTQGADGQGQGRPESQCPGLACYGPMTPGSRDAAGEGHTWRSCVVGCASCCVDRGPPVSTKAPCAKINK